MEQDNHNVAARSDRKLERQMLGAIITDPNILPQIRDLISAECFYDAENRKVWDVIERLEHEGKPYDLMALTMYGIEHGGDELKPVVIADIAGNALHNHIFESADLLRTLMLQRRMVQFGLKCVQFGSEPIVESIDGMIDSMKRKMDTFMETGDSGILNLKDAQYEFIAKINRMRSERNDGEGTMTGFSFFDNFGGLHPTDLIIIAGETSFGKTSFANSIALNAANSGSRICYYSMEMSVEQMASRFISLAEDIRSSKMLYKPTELNDWEMRHIGKAVNKSHTDNIFLFDRSQNNIKNILIGIRTMKAKHDIHGAIIDYIGLIKTDPSSRQSEAGKLNDIARDLKNIAKELGIWIIAISQMSRNNENKDSHLPSINQLKGSGGIAEAADDVILLYRPEKRYPNERFPHPNEMTETKGKALILIEKKRNGEVGNFICDFVGDRTLFIEDKRTIEYGKVFEASKKPAAKDENGKEVNDNMPF